MESSPAGVPEPSVSFEMVPEGVIDFHLSLPRPFSGSLQEQSGPVAGTEHDGLRCTVGDVLVLKDDVEAKPSVPIPHRIRKRPPWARAKE